MHQPVISLIAAAGENNELGAGNQLQWHLPDDFAWFIKHTRGHPVIMGRKTMESLGTPLKNRRNLVVTHSENELPQGFERFHTLEEALESAKTTENNEIFIIGGGQIFAISMDIADRIYLTRIHSAFPGADTFFPETGNQWVTVFSEQHGVDERHQYSFEFQILERG